MSMEKIIQMGIEIGLKTALDTMRKEKEQKIRGRYDRRLRNTKLLLKSYRELMAHCSEAIFRVKRCGENAIDLLDEIDDEEIDDVLYIDSIKKSTERTAAIVAHVDNMLGIFRHICEKSSRMEDIRRYRVIAGLYIDEEPRSVQELAEELSCDPRTVSRDRDSAVVTLSALIFGIDGLRMAT